MKAVITDYIDIPSDTKEKIIKLGVTVYDDTPATEPEIISRIKDAEIITANYIDITANIIDNAPKLKYIVVPAVGFEWVDYKYAASKGIKVLNCPSFYSRAVAEHAVALLFAVARKLNSANISLQRGDWHPQEFKGIEVGGKKLGLIGYGRIGKQIAAIAKGIGMEVTFTNTSSSSDDIDELLRSSDVICMCLPLSDSTRHIVDERRLKMLQPHAILINVGRGATIDQKALIQQLKNNKIAGAGLDVFSHEPLTGQPTDEIVGLANLPNVVATPHMAYSTNEAAERLGKELLEGIISCLSGKPVNIVN